MSNYNTIAVGDWLFLSVSGGATFIGQVGEEVDADTIVLARAYNYSVIPVQSQGRTGFTVVCLPYAAVSSSMRVYVAREHITSFSLFREMGDGVRRFFETKIKEAEDITTSIKAANAGIAMR